VDSVSSQLSRWIDELDFRLFNSGKLQGRRNAVPAKRADKRARRSHGMVLYKGELKTSAWLLVLWRENVFALGNKKPPSVSPGACRLQTKTR
jgi:hypothetical protein